MLWNQRTINRTGPILARRGDVQDQSAKKVASRLAVLICVQPPAARTANHDKVARFKSAFHPRGAITRQDASVKIASAKAKLSSRHLSALSTSTHASVTCRRSSRILPSPPGTRTLWVPHRAVRPSSCILHFLWWIRFFCGEGHPFLHRRKTRKIPDHSIIQAFGNGDRRFPSVKTGPQADF